MIRKGFVENTFRIVETQTIDPNPALVHRTRQSTIDKLWNLTDHYNTLNKAMWSKDIGKTLLEHQVLKFVFMSISPTLWRKLQRCRRAVFRIYETIQFHQQTCTQNHSMFRILHIMFFYVHQYELHRLASTKCAHISILY